jgi:S1-C subfamily serine protease
MNAMVDLPRLVFIGCVSLALARASSGLEGAQVGDVGANTKAAVAAQDSYAGNAPSDAVSGSVVQVFATVRYPNLAKPWSKGSPQEVSGSGTVIEGRRILTNSHVVLYASQIQIQGHGGGDRISAAIESIAPGIDLAVLKLDDESFFDTHPALVRANEVPRIKDPVLVYGYPAGGTNLSVTKGIVSRIEFAGYNAPVSGLRIQIDAAINHGNSGGPAVVGDKMIGLAFSFLNGAQNIGYIIPTEEINLFLRGVAAGGYKGKPAEFSSLQTLENPALRRFLGIPPAVHGVAIQRPGSPDPGYPLKKWDLITRIGDTPVDDQGMVQLEGDLRVSFSYMIQRVVKNDTVPLKVVRGGKQIAVTVPVERNHQGLFPDLAGAYPSYFILGPIVFSQATWQLVSGIDSSNWFSSMLDQRQSPLVTRQADLPSFAGEGIVFVPSPFFPHALAKGYSDPEMRVVSSVNGTSVKNLLHLVEIIRDSRDPYVSIEFADIHCDRLVFPRAEMIAATNQILADNGVRNQGSEDAMKAWNARAPAP